MAETQICLYTVIGAPYYASSRKNCRLVVSKEFIWQQEVIL
jgi:hypothetical protein